MAKEEFNFNKELEKWYKKWMNKRVSGRCLIELKNRDKKFIERLKKKLAKCSVKDEMEWEIDKLSGFETKEKGK